MDIKYIVEDNFLDQIDFENLKNLVLGEAFPWYFKDYVAHTGKHEVHFFWSHMFYIESKAISPFVKLLDPLFKKLETKALIRARANLYSNQGKIIEHEKHTDFPFKHKGALFSLNTCDGFTVLEDGTKIQSVANQILLFDASQPHHSSTCTDAKIRCNININYF